MRLLFTLLFTTTISICFSQKTPIKFGDIPMEDMKMTSYPKDSSASAVILSDYGIAYITTSTSEPLLNFERHVRIKIFKKEGLDYANSSILTYHSGSAEEKVENLKASSYNLEGGKIVESKMAKDGVFKEKYNRNYNKQKFTIPNVKEGSIIEYSYKKSSEFFTNFPNWQFQYTIPVVRSEYWAMIPDVFRYEKFMQGYLTVTNYETKKQTYYYTDVTAHHWLMNAVPAFNEEPFMTSEEDYISKINFALSHINYTTHTTEVMGSWEKLTKDLLEDDDFGKAIDKSGFLKEKVEEITAGISDPKIKIEAISNYIKQNVEWNGEEDFLAGNIKKILEQKTGTSGDINIIFASMLQKAGFDVDMILLSTRSHGFIRQSYPMTRQFNYVICSISLEGKNILLDATEKFLPYDVLPSRCLNGQGLIISKKNNGWIDVVSKTKARTVIAGDFKINLEGELSGKIEYSREGYDAHTMRRVYTKKGEKDYLKDFKESKQWQVEKTEFKDINDLKKPAKEIHEITINEHSSVSGDIIYINPFITAQINENPFKSENREYPIDFGTLIDNTYSLKIILPENLVVDELPKNKVLALPNNSGKYFFSAAQTGNSINVTSIFQINKSLVPQDQYLVIKEFYNQVIAKQAEQIVIKKK